MIATTIVCTYCWIVHSSRSVTRESPCLETSVAAESPGFAQSSVLSSPGPSTPTSAPPGVLVEPSMKRTHSISSADTVSVDDPSLPSPELQHDDQVQKCVRAAGVCVRVRLCVCVDPMALCTAVFPLSKPLRESCFPISNGDSGVCVITMSLLIGHRPLTQTMTRAWRWRSPSPFLVVVCGGLGGMVIIMPLFSAIASRFCGPATLAFTSRFCCPATRDRRQSAKRSAAHRPGDEAASEASPEARTGPGSLRPEDDSGRHRLVTSLENKNQLSRVTDFWQLDTDHLGRQSGSIIDVLQHTSVTMHHR